MKNYTYTVDSVDINWVEDNYERGEVSNVVASTDLDPNFGGYVYQTEDIYSLLNFLDEYIDVRSSYGRGHLQANSTILVDDENNVSNFRIYLTLLAPTAGSDAHPTPSEIEAWRKGEINLYNRNVDISVSITQDASLTVKEISDKLGILVYSKGGELMDSDTEFEYNRGGDVNDDLEQLEEASDMVNTAANLVEDVVPPSLMSNYRAYGRYGFDQLLGKGNPYDKGLDDIGQAIEESYNYEEGEEYAKGGDLSEFKDEEDDIFIVKKIDDKTYDIAVNSNYIYMMEQEGEDDGEYDYSQQISDFEIIDEYINDYWFKGSNDNRVISIDESSYDKEIEGHDIYRIVLKNKLNSKSKNTKTVREIVQEEVGSLDSQQPGEAEVQYFVAYIVGTIFRILDDLKLIDKKNIERAKGLQMWMMDRTPMYLQEHVNCDELNIYAHRQYAAKFYSYDLLNSNLIKSENRERVEEVILEVLQETNFYPCRKPTEGLDYAKGGDIDRDYKMINVGRSSVFTSGFKIYPEALKVGKIYEWTTGAQPLYVRYLGLTKDLNIRSSSSVGSDKYKFQFVGPGETNRYIGLSGTAVRQGNVVQVKNIEELIKEETLSEIKDYEKFIRKAKRAKDNNQIDRLTKKLNEYKSFYKSIDKLNQYAKGGDVKSLPKQLVHADRYDINGWGSIADTPYLDDDEITIMVHAGGGSVKSYLNKLIKGFGYKTKFEEVSREGNVHYYTWKITKIHAKGGKTDDNWIQDVTEEMEKDGTEGAFTKQAKRHKMTPIQFAKKVLKNPKKFSLKTRRRAQFVKNVNPEKFYEGGNISQVSKVGDPDYPNYEL